MTGDLIVAESEVEASMAEVERVADLSDADRAAVRDLGRAVYPPAQFADWPGRALEWATPEWCVRVRGEDGALLSYVGAYLRDALCDDGPARVGGIGNVKTHPAARRRGFAGLAIRGAVEFFATQTVDFGLLVCEPELIAYYARLGWRPFTGRLLVRQRGAVVHFTLCDVMTLAVQSEAPTDGVIDLCGPPW